MLNELSSPCSQVLFIPEAALSRNRGPRGTFIRWGLLRLEPETGNLRNS